jgi:adenylate cyclase
MTSPPISLVTGMFVIARESAYAYRSKAVDVRKLGEELGVRYVLEGSVRKVGDALRVNAQLIDAETGAHLWADRFDVEPRGFGAGQDVIVARPATTLGMEVMRIEAARGARERPANPDARALILRARALQNQPANIQRQEASRLQLDPSSSFAMARLAKTLISLRLEVSGLIVGIGWMATNNGAR